MRSKIRRIIKIMQRLTPYNLQTDGKYRQLLRFHHRDVLPFVGEYYLRKRNWVIWLNYLLNLGCILWTLAVGIWQGTSTTSWLISLGLAVLIWVVLIPLHEAIHGLVYWLLGARDIHFGGSLRLMYFYAVAHDFVINSRELIWLALAPFLVINGGLLVLALVSPQQRLLALILSLLHLSAVGGDWAMLGYLWEQRGGEIYTFDDINEQMSYFYQQGSSI
jgi:hypothetical protein